jgi:hypothetical protein
MQKKLAMFRMSKKHLSRKYARRASALLVACLFLFSGIASAFCSLDQSGKQIARHGMAPASAASAPQSHQGGTDDVCPGIPDPDKEDSKAGAQWDHAPAAYTLFERVFVSPASAAIAAARRKPIVEPVFRHFPRLLI